MKCLKRNLRSFQYRPYLDWSEDGDTGEDAVEYGDAVDYEGNISPANHEANVQVFGTLTDYTHILVMDNPDVSIDENGLIIWKGDTYVVKRVAPTLNCVRIAIKRVTTNVP